MPEYDLDFAEKLSKTAALVAAQGLATLDAKRTVLYLSLLATEIAIKAMLEKAGEPVCMIRKRSHDLQGLTSDLGKCKIEIVLGSGTSELVSAARLRAIEIIGPKGNVTVGQILEAEAQGASRYPNQIRYGRLLRHFPPESVASMAAEVAKFARAHWQSLQK